MKFTPGSCNMPVMSAKLFRNREPDFHALFNFAKCHDRSITLEQAVSVIGGQFRSKKEQKVEAMLNRMVKERYLNKRPTNWIVNSDKY